MLVTTAMGGFLIGVLFWVLLIGALIWLVGIARREYRRFISVLENMCNTLDDSRRALQVMCDRLQSTERVLGDSSRWTSQGLEANARALGEIREALQNMKRG